MIRRGSYKKLIGWQKSMDVVKDIYGISTAYPKEEKYGIISQIRRACISIPSNIAEGNARNSDKHFIQFLETTQGSAYEFLTQLELSYMIGYIDKDTLETIEEKLIEVCKLIGGLIKSLK